MAEPVSIKDYSRDNFKFSKKNYNVGYKPSTTISEITEWGKVLIAPGMKISTKISKMSWTIRVECYVKGGGAIPEDIQQKIINEVYRIGKLYPEFEEAYLDQNYVGIYVKFGKKCLYIPNDKDDRWVEAHFSAVYDEIKEGKKVYQAVDYLIWRIGDYVLGETYNYASDLLSAMVLDYYCDRYVPTKNEEGRVQVSFEGFSLIFYWLWKLIYRRILTENTAKTKYNEFRKNYCLPLIPMYWHEDDINFMNINKLAKIVEDIGEDTQEKDAPKKDQPASQKSGKNTTTGSQESNQEDGKNLVKNTLEFIKNIVGNIVETTYVNPNITPKLSELLDVTNNVNHLYQGEYVVNINTGITVDKIHVNKDKILAAIISYGVLEILIEKDVLEEDIIEGFKELFEFQHRLAIEVYIAGEENAFKYFKGKAKK